MQLSFYLFVWLCLKLNKWFVQIKFYFAFISSLFVSLSFSLLFADSISTCTDLVCSVYYSSFVAVYVQFYIMIFLYFFLLNVFRAKHSFSWPYICHLFRIDSNFVVVVFSRWVSSSSSPRSTVNCTVNVCSARALLLLLFGILFQFYFVSLRSTVVCDARVHQKFIPKRRKFFIFVLFFSFSLQFVFSIAFSRLAI